jgi:hypothetical protein
MVAPIGITRRGVPMVSWRDAVKTIATLLLLSSVGCATVPTPVTFSDTKPLVGLWRGSVPCRGCLGYLPASLLIRDDATWSAIVDERGARTQSVDQASNQHGVLGVVDGVLRWGQDGRWYGRVTVVEHRGYEYLSMLDEHGQVWTEFQRAR